MVVTKMQLNNSGLLSVNTVSYRSEVCKSGAMITLINQFCRAGTHSKSADYQHYYDLFGILCGCLLHYLIFQFTNSLKSKSFLLSEFDIKFNFQ